MGNLDPAKILMVLVIALVVLGPDRLPRAARSMGAALNHLVRLREQVAEEVRSALPDVDLPRIPTIRRGVVSGFLTDLTRPQPGERARRADAAEDVSVAAPIVRDTSSPGALVILRPNGDDAAFLPDDPNMN